MPPEIRAHVASGAPTYARVPRALLRDPAMSANAVRLFALLEDRCSRDEPVAFPAKKTLAAAIGSTSAVERAMGLLVEAGWVLRQERRRPDGSQTSNLYVLAFTPPHPASGAPPTPLAVPHPTPLAGSHEGNPEVRTTPQPPKGGRARREVADGDPGWDAFWSAYPKKVGKGAARRAWPKALDKVGGDHTVLVAAGRRYAGSITEIRYACNPATWLNGERWTDDTDGLKGGLRPDPTRRVNPRKAEECQIHAGQFADQCAGCRVDALAVERPVARSQIGRNR